MDTVPPQGPRSRKAVPIPPRLVAGTLSKFRRKGARIRAGVSRKFRHQSFLPSTRILPRRGQLPRIGGNGCASSGRPTPLTPDSKPRPHVTVGVVDFDITEAIFQFAYPLDRLPPRGPAPACTAQPTSQAAPQQPLPDQ